MKRLICIFLIVALLLGCGAPVYAAESVNPPIVAQAVDEDALPFVLVRGMDFMGLRYDCGTENERSVLGEITVSGVVGTLFKALFTSLVNFDKKAGVQTIIDYAYDILKGFSCDKDGSSLYDNVSCNKYPLAVSNYPDAGFENEVLNELGIVRTSMEKLGAQNTYYINYDWRMNPLDVADEINEVINRALADSGKSKVNLACASMGGVMTVAYLTKYGGSKLDKCIFLSSTFNGAYVTGDLFKGNVNFGASEVTAFAQSMLGENKGLSVLITVLDKIGAIKGITKLLNQFVANNKDEVFDQLLTPCFGSMLSLWALTQPDDVQPAMDYLFRNNKDEYASLITKINELKSMMLSRDAMLRQMSADGLKISVVSTYNNPLIPVYEHSYVNGDGTLESRFMTGGATVADYGKTLGDDYVSPDPAYVSPDNIVDASTCLFPDNTWLIKDGPHVGCSYGTDMSDFLFWMLEYEGRPTIHSNDRYPQYMLSSNDQELRLWDAVPVYN